MIRNIKNTIKSSLVSLNPFNDGSIWTDRRVFWFFFYCGFEEPNKSQINLRAECASNAKSNKREVASGGVTGFRYSRIVFHLWRLFSFQPLRTPKRECDVTNSLFQSFSGFACETKRRIKFSIFNIITIATDPLTYWPKVLHCFDCAAHSWMPHSKNTTK